MAIAEADLSDIQARDALRRLVAAYSRAVDRRDFALLRSLYDDDAHETHGHRFSGGPDAYVAYVTQALSRYASTTHYILNASFEIRGDLAEGELYKINYHRSPEPDGYEVVTGSRSLDRYRRRDGRWRFVSRFIVLDWSTRRPVDPAAYADFVATSPPAVAGPADRSYDVLGWLGRYPADQAAPPACSREQAW